MHYACNASINQQVMRLQCVIVIVFAVVVDVRTAGDWRCCEYFDDCQLIVKQQSNFICQRTYTHAHTHTHT